MTDISAVILLQVNPVRAKELSNVRSAGKDENVKLTPPRLVSTLRPVCYSVVCFYVLSYIYMNFSLLEWFFRSSLFLWILGSYAIYSKNDINSQSVFGVRQWNLLLIQSAFYENENDRKYKKLDKTKTNGCRAPVCNALVLSEPS